MLPIEKVQQTLLAGVGWRFGQSYCGGPVAQQMIMHCIANRVRSGWGNWFDVIQKVPYFMAENQLPPLEFPAAWDAAFQKLLLVVEGVFDGSIPDMSKGALYWADLNRLERPWFKEKIIDSLKDSGLRQHPIVATVNSLSFFR